jgi:hypothetical protein
MRSRPSAPSAGVVASTPPAKASKSYSLSPASVPTRHDPPTSASTSAGTGRSRTRCAPRSRPAPSTRIAPSSEPVTRLASWQRYGTRPSSRHEQPGRVNVGHRSPSSHPQLRPRTRPKPTLMRSQTKADETQLCRGPGSDLQMALTLSAPLASDIAAYVTWLQCSEVLM